MNRKLTLLTALSMLLMLTIAGSPAVALPDSPDTDSEYEAQAPPPAPEPGDTPDAPTWTCPKCGAECPAPYGRRGREMRAPRHQRGFGQGIGHDGYGKNRQGRRGRGDGLAADRMLRGASRLELTDDQIAQLEKLSYDAKTKLIDLNSELEKSRLELRRQMETDGEDLSAMKKQMEANSQIRVNIQMLKLENWIDAKKVLTDDQKKLIKDRHPRMGMRL
jgi:Spy/CpxP family protein refolding chaperone